jgi:hypothetical protein
MARDVERDRSGLYNHDPDLGEAVAHQPTSTSPMSDQEPVHVMRT